MRMCFQYTMDGLRNHLNTLLIFAWVGLSAQTHLSNIKQLTFGGQNAEAYWAPDGKRLIFQSTRDNLECDQIYVMNADGTGARNLTHHPAQDNYAAWSPDGKRIAFISNRAGGYDIFVMDVD